MRTIQIVFDGPPGAEAGRFVEVEENGRSINFGEWREGHNDGYWYLDIPVESPAPSVSRAEVSDMVDEMLGIVGNGKATEFMCAWLKERGIPVGDKPSVSEPDAEDERLTIEHLADHISGPPANWEPPSGPDYKAMVEVCKIALRALDESMPPVPDHVCGTPNAMCDCSCVDFSRWAEEKEFVRKALADIERRHGGKP